MNASDWKKLRPILSAQITTELDALGPWRRKGSMTWIQQYPGIVQTVGLEKMRTNTVRVRVFVTNDRGVTIGGSLSLTTIGGGGVAGPEYLWPVGNEETIVRSAKAIVSAVKEFAVPWFRAFSCVSRVNEAPEIFPQPYSWAMDYSDLFDLSAPTLEPDAIAKEWLAPRALLEEIRKPIEEILNARGAARVGDGLAWVRRRNEIHDAIHIIPFNYATQLYCLSYNWISELSVDESGIYSEHDMVALVGGAVKTPNDGGETPRLCAFPVATIADRQDSVSTLREVLIHQIDTVLPRVKDKTTFVALAREKYPEVVEAYEL